MFTSHLKSASRNLIRHKGYSFLNMAGLTLGVAGAALILLWVQDEVSFDRFNRNADSIYRVVFSSSDDGSTTPTNANGSFGVGPALKREFPEEVLEVARIRKMELSAKWFVRHKDTTYYESRFFFAEPTILTVFDFPLVRGDSATALREPNTIVLTQEMAKKYFRDDDPIGKTIEADLYNDGENVQFRVTGVAKDVPRLSHVHFDFLASYSSQREDTDSFDGFYQHYTYVLLNSRSSAASLNTKLLDVLRRNWQEDPWYTISLQPLLDIRLRSGLRSEIEPTGNILSVYIFTAIALFLLAIAGMNFINLSTARAARRAKEVGIRKAMGAQRGQLVRQFLGESVAFGVSATCFAIPVVLLALPMFNRLTGKLISPASLAGPGFVLGIAAVALSVGLISGIYPALLLSSFKPMHSLASRTGHSRSGALMRRGLVILQFVLSIGVIGATLIAHKQMRHVQSWDTGYDKEQIVAVPLNSDLRQRFDGFRSELLRHPGIENVTTSAYVPTTGSAHLSMRFEGKDKDIEQVVYCVGKEFMETYGLKLLAGRDIRQPLSTDGTADFLVSERTVREAGYSSHEEALGKSVSLEGYRGHIVGIVRDINIYSLHEEPQAISYAQTSIRGHDFVSIRIDTEDVPQTVARIREVWRKMVPGYPLDYSFLGSRFADMHSSDRKLSEVVSVFSILAILVACIGLFGLAAFTAEQRTREIGVRKALGASAASIYVLLSKESLTWVAVAALIAWPLAFFVMSRWLQGFAYRTDIGAGVFLLSGLLALTVAQLTVSLQTIRAARARPVDSLRHE